MATCSRAGLDPSYLYAFLKSKWFSLATAELPRCPLLNGLLNVFLLFSAAGWLPRDWDPVAADSGLEHGDIAVQLGSVPRGWEVVLPGHELHPPPGIPAGELWDTGTQLWKGRQIEVRLCAEVHNHHSHSKDLLVFFSCAPTVVWSLQRSPRQAG